MGKRKRISDHTQSQKDHHPFSPSPSAEAIRCSSDMEVLSDEKASHSGDPGALPLPHVLDLTDGSMNLLNTHQTVGHPHQSLGRSIFLKRSRHYYGHQYFQRNSANHANASSSRGKGTSLYNDNRLSFKLASQPNSQSRQHAEYREKTFSRPERIRSSSISIDAVSLDVVKMVCGICQKSLRRKFNHMASSMSSCCELSVVAVLVCGHAYHADCLEQRTSIEEQRDPPCPMCAGLLLQVHDSKGQE